MKQLHAQIGLLSVTGPLLLLCLQEKQCRSSDQK
jgi:hypothetical protein